MKVYRAALTYVIPLLISVSIGVMLVKQVRLVALSNSYNVQSFFSFSEGLEQYKQLRQEWRPRIATNYLAGQFAHFLQAYTRIEDPSALMKYLPSVWNAGWYLLACLLFIGLFRIKSLFYLFGLYAGISFGYLPDLGNNFVYPWDLPALFVFACFVVILEKKREPLLLAFVPIAILFKETALLMAAAFLFWDQASTRRRIGYLLATLAAGLVTKVLVDLVTGNPSILFTMTTNGVPEKWRYLGNWASLLPLRTSHPLFINAGLLVTLFLLPLKDRRILLMKAIAVPFALGQFFFGVIVEFRIWFELIPLALYGLDLVYLRGETQASPALPA